MASEVDPLQSLKDLLLEGAGENRPGPFSMGLIAVREFDMYGDRPELAVLINEVQRAMQAILGKP